MVIIDDSEISPPHFLSPCDAPMGACMCVVIYYLLYVFTVIYLELKMLLL